MTEQNAVFAQCDSDGRRVEIGLHQRDIPRSGSQGRWNPLRDLLLSQQLLPAIRHVSSEFVFQKTVPQHIGHAMLSDINISQGIV